MGSVAEGMYSLEAETAIIGAALMRPDFVMAQVELRVDQFHDARCRTAWDAITGLVAKNVAVDLVTMENALGERLEALGGLLWLTEAMRSVPTADNVKFYAGIVADFATKRQVVYRLSEALERARRPDASGEEALAHATDAITGIDVAKDTDALPIADVIKAAARDAHARGTAAQNGDALAFGVPTGLTDLDKLMAGITEGAVTIVAGRPSHGKSSLVRSIADNANAKGAGVHVFTLEDQASTYGLRVLADHSRVDLGKLRSMTGIQKGELDNMTTAANRIMQRTGWLVDDTAGLSSAQIAMRVRRHKRVNKTRLVIVDYVQLMREPTARRGDKGDEVAKAAEALVQLARTERVAVVVLSQLSRDCEKRDDKRPMLSDLRETGVLEQVAESVLFVFQPQRYLDKEKNRQAWERWENRGKVIVAKHKNSATGEVELMWDANTATYRDLAWRPDEQGKRVWMGGGETVLLKDLPGVKY